MDDPGAIIGRSVPTGASDDTLKLRVLPSILAPFAALIGATVLQVVVGIVLWVAGLLPHSLSAIRDDPSIMTDPRTGIPLIVAAQAAFLLVAVGGAWLSRSAWRTRLSIRRARLPLWTFLLILPATRVATIAAVPLLMSISKAPSEHLKEIQGMVFAGGSWQQHALWLLAIGITPGVCEELLCRGYVQTRLVAHWGPLAGILVSAVLFALLHLDPQHMLIALFLGVWCGFVAWRTGSVIPAVLCHAFNNSIELLAAWTVKRHAEPSWGDSFELRVSIVFMVVLILAPAVWLLFRYGRPAGGRVP